MEVTGGYKITSIAGAVLTLNRKVVCQYVQSDGPLPRAGLAPFIYDFRWDPSLNI